MVRLPLQELFQQGHDHLRFQVGRGLHHLPGQHSPGPLQIGGPVCTVGGGEGLAHLGNELGRGTFL